MENLSLDVEKFSGLVIFSLDEWEFCIDFQRVLLILKKDELINIENLNSLLHGPGEAAPADFLALNFAKCFGIRENGVKANERMIFAQYDNVEFSFCVDSIKEIITLDTEFVKNKLEFIWISGTDNIKGLIRFENRTFLFPDYDKIIKEELSKKSEPVV
jgi:purine-binding chemotaxis protein CheW